MMLILLLKLCHSSWYTGWVSWDLWPHLGIKRRHAYMSFDLSITSPPTSALDRSRPMSNVDVDTRELFHLIFWVSCSGNSFFDVSHWCDYTYKCGSTGGRFMQMTLSSNFHMSILLAQSSSSVMWHARILFAKLCHFSHILQFSILTRLVHLQAECPSFYPDRAHPKCVHSSHGFSSWFNTYVFVLSFYHIFAGLRSPFRVWPSPER